MKKILFSLCTMMLVSGMVMFSGHANAMPKKHKKGQTDSTATATGTPAVSTNPASTNPSSVPPTTLKADDMAFSELSHDFGTVSDDQDGQCVFTFTNKGNEPIVIQKAQPSCGCTVPTYSKEPVLPGKVGTIDVTYHTKGKPAGGFQKTITVVSNAGTKVLTIKGVMEKAPANSVPENTSMLKTN